MREPSRQTRTSMLVLITALFAVAAVVLAPLWSPQQRLAKRPVSFMALVR